MIAAIATRLSLGTLLVLQLFLAVPSRDGRVLCIEKDGRVEIEAAQHGRCVAEPHQRIVVSGGILANATTESTHCDACTDIPLLAAQAASRTQSMRSFAPDVFAKLLWVHIPDSVLAASAPSATPSGSHLQIDAVASQSTPILLI